MSMSLFACQSLNVLCWSGRIRKYARQREEVPKNGDSIVVWDHTRTPPRARSGQGTSSTPGRPESVEHDRDRPRPQFAVPADVCGGP
jgi:hypothetical protein